MGETTVAASPPDAGLVDEWVRCAKRGDPDALALLRSAIDSTCGWPAESRSRALFALWKVTRDGSSRDALEALATAEDAPGVIINKWAATLDGEDAVRALMRADAAPDRAAGKAACRLGDLALRQHDGEAAARWYRRAADSGCSGGHFGLYTLSERHTTVVSEHEGLACLAQAVAAEDGLALAAQSHLSEAEGDFERAIHYMDLAVAAARRDGASSLRWALRAATLRFGPDALHGNFQTPVVVPGNAAEQLREAIFSELSGGKISSLRRAIVVLGRLLAFEGRVLDDALTDPVAALAGKGYRPAIALAEALRIDFNHTSNELALEDRPNSHLANTAGRSEGWFSRTRELFEQMKQRLAQDPADADAFWNTYLASVGCEDAARLSLDVALLSLRTQLAHALGRRRTRDSLLAKWESISATLPAWRQSEEFERCASARVRYALSDGDGVAKMRVRVGGHPAALCAAATIMGAMGKPDLGLWVLSLLRPEADTAPAKTSLLRAELEAQSGCASMEDALACYSLIDDRDAKPIDRQRACVVFAHRASETAIACRIPQLMSASTISMLSRALLTSSFLPSTQIMASCARHYFDHPHAEHYAEALVDLMRAQLWAGYNFGDRALFLELLACIGDAARARAQAGALHPGTLRQILTMRPESWLHIFDTTSWKDALDAIGEAVDRAEAGPLSAVKSIVREVAIRHMRGTEWPLPLSRNGAPNYPRLPMPVGQVLELLRDAARCVLGGTLHVGVSENAPDNWIAAHAVQEGIGRLLGGLADLRDLIEDAAACEQSVLSVRVESGEVLLDVSMRLTEQGVLVARRLLRTRPGSGPIGPGLFNWSMFLIPNGIARPSDQRLQAWISQGGSQAFWDWWTSFTSEEARISGVLRALAWQCDHTWMRGHQAYSSAGPPARGVLHSLKNRLDHRIEGPELLPWLRAQLHALRRDAALELAVWPPSFAAADLGAILSEVFDIEPALPATLVSIAPDLLRAELYELWTNSRKYALGTPRVTLSTEDDRVQVVIENDVGETQSDTQYGIEGLLIRLSGAGITVDVRPGSKVFAVSLGFLSIPQRKAA